MVCESLLRLLHSKLHRRPPSPSDKAVVDRFSEVEAWRFRPAKTGAGRGAPARVKGVHHDLSRIAETVNRTYFNSTLAISSVAWTVGKPRRRLAYYRTGENAIRVSRALDHPSVPGFYMEYILFHEMLHALLGPERWGRAWVFHHSRFKRMEREFPDYERSKTFERMSLPRLR